MSIIKKYCDLYLKDYNPDFKGISFNGYKILGNSKLVDKIEYEDLLKFIEGIESEYDFDIIKNDYVLIEENPLGNNEYLIYKKNYIGLGFELYSSQKVLSEI